VEDLQEMWLTLHGRKQARPRQQFDELKSQMAQFGLGSVKGKLPEQYRKKAEGRIDGGQHP
jgi:hypothetical protein